MARFSSAKRTPATRSPSMIRSRTEHRVRTSAPASRAAVSRRSSSTSLRGAYAMVISPAGGACPDRTNSPRSRLKFRIGGQPVPSSRSSRPQRERYSTPLCQTMCVEAARSLGNGFRSRIRTLWPLRASSIATELPAHRAPTTMASYRGVATRPSRRNRRAFGQAGRPASSPGCRGRSPSCR